MHLGLSVATLPLLLLLGTAPAAAEVGRCQYFVFFGVGNADLTERASSRMNEAAASALRNGAARIIVEGHADRFEVGNSVTAAAALSRRRAEAIADLLERSGVDRARLEIRPHGFELPMLPHARHHRWSTNRRAEVDLCPDQRRRNWEVPPGDPDASVERRIGPYRLAVAQRYLRPVDWGQPAEDVEFYLLWPRLRSNFEDETRRCLRSYVIRPCSSLIHVHVRASMRSAEEAWRRSYAEDRLGPSPHGSAFGLRLFLPEAWQDHADHGTPLRFGEPIESAQRFATGDCHPPYKDRDGYLVEGNQLLPVRDAETMLGVPGAHCEFTFDLRPGLLVAIGIDGSLLDEWRSVITAVGRLVESFIVTPGAN
jgi:hypothetical protein